MVIPELCYIIEFDSVAEIGEDMFHMLEGVPVNAS